MENIIFLPFHAQIFVSDVFLFKLNRKFRGHFIIFPFFNFSLVRCGFRTWRNILWWNISIYNYIGQKLPRRTRSSGIYIISNSSQQKCPHYLIFSDCHIPIGHSSSINRSTDRSPTNNRSIPVVELKRQSCVANFKIHSVRIRLLARMFFRRNCQ